MQTGNIQKRLQEHNTGILGGYTAKRLPVQLMYYEHTDTLQNTLKVETQIKKWSRSKKEALINKNFKKLSDLSKNSF